jgi:hypothetical protein
MKVIDQMTLNLLRSQEAFRKDPKSNATYIDVLNKNHNNQILNATRDKNNARSEGRFKANIIFDADMTADGSIVFEGEEYSLKEDTPVVPVPATGSKRKLAHY